MGLRGIELSHEGIELFFVSLGDSTEDALLDSLFGSVRIGVFEERCDVRIGRVGKKTRKVVIEWVFVLGEPFFGVVFHVCSVMSQNEALVSYSRWFELFGFAVP
jgi:hypothetical protein